MRGQGGTRAGGRGRRADAVRNRGRVLEATWRLLRERGPADVSMEEVAREADIGKGTLYRHYPSRECLFEAVMREGAERIAATMRERIPTEAAAPVKLRAVVALVYDAYEEHNINVGVLLDTWRATDALQGDPSGPPHPVGEVIGRLRGILEQGVREGSFRQLDLDYTAGAIFSLISPLAFAKQRARLGYGRADLEQRVLDLILHALQATPGAS